MLSTGETVEDASFDCAICHGRIASAYTTPCDHSFCRSCFLSWANESFSRQRSQRSLTVEMFTQCPLCRRKLASNLIPNEGPATVSWLTAKHDSYDDSDDDSDDEQDDTSRNLVEKRDKRAKWMIKPKGPATDAKRAVAAKDDAVSLPCVMLDNDSAMDKLESSKVHIHLHPRRGKFITTVEGLADDLDVQKIVQHLRASLHCGGSVLKVKGAAASASASGSVFQLSGDQRVGVRKFFNDEELCSHIVVHGG